MKNVLSFLLLLATLSVFSSDFNKEIDASTIERVILKMPSGNIQIRGDNIEKVVALGSLAESASISKFELLGSQLEIVIEQQQGKWASNDSSEIVITLPKRLNVFIESQSADIQVANLKGAVAIQSQSGAISIKDILSLPETQHRFTTVSGDIAIDNLNGNLDLTCVSGDISARLTSQKVSANLVSGDLNLVSAQLVSADISTVSGDVLVKTQADSNKGMSISGSSVNGELVIDVNQDFTGSIEAHTGPGGDIENYLSSDKPDSTFIGDEHLSIRLGKQSSNRIQLSTVSGTLIIR